MLRGCGVKCRQLSSFPEDPGLTELSARGALDTAPTDEEPSDDRDIAPPPPPRCAGDESENRRHPLPSEADDFPTSLRTVKFAGEDNVPRAAGWLWPAGWFCTEPEPKCRQPWLSIDWLLTELVPLSDD